MVCGLLWKGGAAFGVLVPQFPWLDHHHWVREQQGGTEHAGNATVLLTPFLFISLKVEKHKTLLNIIPSAGTVSARHPGQGK